MTLTPKQEMSKTATFTPPPAALKALSTNHKVPVAASPVSASDSRVSSTAAEPPADDVDEELEQLLSLQKPSLGDSGNQSVTAADEESVTPEKSECIQHALFELSIKSSQRKGVVRHFGKYTYSVCGGELDEKIDTTSHTVNMKHTDWKLSLCSVQSHQNFNLKVQSF